MPSYPSPAGEARAEIREKGSRFLAILGPAAGEEAAKAWLAALERELPDATHHCWAWRLGDPPRERSSDAGEPAGVPMLQVLRGAPGLPVALRVPTARLALRLPYERVGAVKRLVHPPAVELETEEYGEEARLVLVVHKERVAALRASLADLGIRHVLFVETQATVVYTAQQDKGDI